MEAELIELGATIAAGVATGIAVAKRAFISACLSLSVALLALAATLEAL